MEHRKKYNSYGFNKKPSVRDSDPWKAFYAMHDFWQEQSIWQEQGIHGEPVAKPSGFHGQKKAGKLRMSGTKGAHRIGKR